MKYTVDYFIKKFQAIPEERIISGSQSDNFGNHCAVGWCKNEIGEYGCANSIDSNECFYLEQLFFNAGIICVTFDPENRNGWNIADVNNGDHPAYPQPTPKQRILAALMDIKAMQDGQAAQPTHKDITSSLAVLPVEEKLDLIKKPVTT